MATSLFDTSIPSYLQTLRAISGVLGKGAEHCAQQGMDPGELVEAKLREDMLPLRFQVISVCHHSLGAIRGIQDGVFTPPPSMPDLDYAGLQSLVDDAIVQLEALSAEEVNALAGKSLVFKLGKTEMPFVAEDFILSFSLPNFYFHATTAYGILRMLGVKLGKMDYLGQMRMGG